MPPSTLPNSLPLMGIPRKVCWHEGLHSRGSSCQGTQKPRTTPAPAVPSQASTWRKASGSLS